MPELFRFFGIRFFFFSNEHLPMHVHIRNADETAKFQVESSIILVSNNGIKNKDLLLAESIIEENKELIVEYWNLYFNIN